MWHIIGHDRTVAELTKLVSTGALPTAAIISGAAGTGKTHLALELAKAVNCLETDNPPCQSCAHCRQIDGGTHPDVVVVERLDGKNSIAIQLIREVREGAVLRPFQASKKVYIVAGAEDLTPQAADALLKLLEEPPLHLLLLLTVMDVEGVPETVLSRCRVIALRPVHAATLAGALEGQGTKPEDAARLSRLAQGNVGWGLRAAKQPNLADQREELVEKVTEALGSGIATRLDLAESLSADRKDRSAVRRGLEILALLGRDMLLLSQGRAPILVHGEQESVLSKLAARYNLDQIQRHLSGVKVAMQRVDENVDPRLALEALLLQLP